MPDLVTAGLAAGETQAAVTVRLDWSSMARLPPPRATETCESVPWTMAWPLRTSASRVVVSSAVRFSAEKSKVLTSQASALVLSAQTVESSLTTVSLLASVARKMWPLFTSVFVAVGRAGGHRGAAGGGLVTGGSRTGNGGEGEGGDGDSGEERAEHGANPCFLLAERGE